MCVHVPVFVRDFIANAYTHRISYNRSVITLSILIFTVGGKFGFSFKLGRGENLARVTFNSARRQVLRVTAFFSTFIFCVVLTRLSFLSLFSCCCSLASCVIYRRAINFNLKTVVLFSFSFTTLFSLFHRLTLFFWKTIHCTSA